MIIKAKLFFRNEEIELLTFDLTLSRDFNILNGRPTSMLLKVPVKVTYISRENDSIFFEYMKKERLDREEIKPPYNTYDIFSYKIVLYQDDYDGPAIKTFYFENGLPTYYKEEFNNQTGMITTLKLEAAVIHVGDGLYVNTFWDETMRKRLESQATSNKPKPAEKFYVDAISIEELEEGSSNSGDIFSPPKKGMVYGKEYTLKVTKYRNDKAPSNLNKIKWRCNYISADRQMIMGKIEQCGDEITFKADNLDYCGCTLTFYAYIENNSGEASLDVFHHYRFKWFDRDIIKDEVEERRNKPFLANQKNTPLCGMAAIMYILAKKDFYAYKKLILELHRKGVSKVNDYEIDVSNSKHLLEMNPITNIEYPFSKNAKPYKMYYCDWISFSLIRDNENLFRDYDGGGDWSFDGATLPYEIEKFAYKMFKAENVIDRTNLIAKKSTLLWGDASSREVAKMQKLYLKGYEVFILINTEMIYKKKSGFFSTIQHWAVFEGIIEGTITWDEYDFQIFTWGEIKDIVINPEIFSTNYYGYVAFK